MVRVDELAHGRELRLSLHFTADIFTYLKLMALLDPVNSMLMFSGGHKSWLKLYRS